MATTRNASTHWEGTLFEGAGKVTLESSGLGTYDVSWASRAEDANGKTSPEELIAAAHAGCFSMALSAQLGNAGMTADSIATTATVNLEKTDAGFTITAVHLDVNAKIPGADKAAFDTAANNAKAGCPVSKLLNTKITLDAKLQ